MQKRRYMDGFYVSSSKGVSDRSLSKTNYSASLDSKYEAASDFESNGEAYFVAESCDTIYLRSGAKMIVKVTDVNALDIHYYLCEGKDKTEFKLETKNLKRVCFATGKVDSLKTFNAPDTPKKNPVADPVNTNIDKVIKKTEVSACDTLYTREGKKILCKVNGVYFDKTLYVLCKSDNQAEWDVETKSLKRICYGNGSIDSLKSVPVNTAPSHGYEPNQNSEWGNQRSAELDKAINMVDKALWWTLAGCLIAPGAGIYGYILAIRAMNILRGKRGYEEYYKRARILFIVKTILYAIVLFYIILLLALIYFI